MNKEKTEMICQITVQDKEIESIKTKLIVMENVLRELKHILNRPVKQKREWQKNNGEQVKSESVSRLVMSDSLQSHRL